MNLKRYDEVLARHRVGWGKGYEDRPGYVVRTRTDSTVDVRVFGSSRPFSNFSAGQIRKTHDG